LSSATVLLSETTRCARGASLRVKIGQAASDGRNRPEEPCTMSGDDRRRKLALTLSGGAVLTLISATAAHGAPGTGETSATGNRSNTAAGQTLNMTDGGVVTLNGGVANAGGAGSNSGINQAVGNSDENDDSVENVDGRINNDSV